MSAAKDLLGNYQQIIDELTLVPGNAGIFDVTANGEILFSKHTTGRHAEPGEVLDLFGQSIRR